MQPHRGGFTLIELSIVLVIIGLIAGGVLVGRDLIEAARIRKIVSAHQELVTQWNTFRLKYNCLPGDCSNATSFFGQAAACTTTTGSGTCNGNGDKYIHSTPLENKFVWNHLYHAKLYNYVGHTGEAPLEDYNKPYVTAPNGPSSIAWWIGGTSPATNLAQMYGSTANDNSGSNLAGIGVQTTRATDGSIGYQPREAIEPPSVVRNLDTKIDDGIPATGKFRASGGYAHTVAANQTCITGSGGSSAYDLTQTIATCRYIYSIQ